MHGNSRFSESRRTVLSSLGAVGALLAGTGFASAAPGRDSAGQRDEVLVGVADGADRSRVERRALAAVPADASVTHRNERLGYFAVELPAAAADRGREAVADAIANRRGVDYAEPNSTYETQVAPNDPGFDTQQAPQAVDAPAAWETTFGSEDVTVAVVDTGVQYGHPDLAGQFGDTLGTDVVGGDGDPELDTAEEGHGTHVAGCAAASTDNGTGVAGVSDSRLLSVRVVDESGYATLSAIADGIQWAADQGADILNLSLGGGDAATLANAVDYAADRDVCLFAAAGNTGESVMYPAAYERCVGVAALDPDENLASFSNRGPNVDVAAPGVNVVSTYPVDDYRAFSGTSMASPVAAGVAALGLAADPDLSAADLRRRLAETAVDVGLPAEEQGAGRVDAANIVAAAESDSGNDGEAEDTSEEGADSGGDDGDTCNASVGGSVDGSLGFFESDAFRWDVYYTEPCEVTVELAAADDFDLYVTRDGRVPTASDHDLRSSGSDGSGTVTVTSPESGGAVGILVDADWDSGAYTLSVTESGSGTASTQRLETGALLSSVDQGDTSRGRGSGRGATSPPGRSD